jgi:hypothetical protein
LLLRRRRHTSRCKAGLFRKPRMAWAEHRFARRRVNALRVALHGGSRPPAGAALIVRPENAGEFITRCAGDKCRERTAHQRSTVRRGARVVFGWCPGGVRRVSIRTSGTRRVRTKKYPRPAKVIDTGGVSGREACRCSGALIWSGSRDQTLSPGRALDRRSADAGPRNGRAMGIRKPINSA